MQQITPTPNYTALHAHGPRPSARARENAVKNGNPFPETAFLCSSISQTGFRSRARRFAAILILAVIPGCSSAAAASAHADCEVAQSVFEADMQFLKQR